MNTFSAIMTGLVLIITSTVMTSFFTKQRTLKDFKNSLLTSKKEGKMVALVVDGLKISVNPKDIKVEILES